MDMTDTNDADITSPIAAISNLSIEQIVKCIDNHLETNLDVVITNFNPKEYPVDRYQWNIELDGVAGYISVRIDPKGVKIISYGINNREQGKAVELAAIYWQCMHACLNLATLTEHSNTNDIPSEVADLFEKIEETKYKEIAYLTNQGYTQGAIAEREKIGYQTVKNYLKEMRDKYNKDGKEIVLTAKTRKKLGIKQIRAGADTIEY